MSELASIIIVNWNGGGYLEESIESALMQTYRPKELIVVDNGSTDGSCDWLRARAQNRFVLVELISNEGFAGGTNAGIRASHGDFVALLNNDAVAAPTWLEQLVATMSDPKIGMAASKILFYDRRDIIDKVGHLLYPDGLNRGRGAGEVDRGQYDHSTEILFPDGCAALYRRAMLQEIGLFDEQFFAYGDDADLGLRGCWHGWKSVYAPTAVVYHRHSSSLGKYSPRKAFLVERNRLWVALKLFPLPLLLITPVFTLWRFFWHVWSIVGKRGLAGGVTRDHSPWGLLVALAMAYASGLRGLIQIIKKRRQIFRHRRIGSIQFYSLMWRFRISARALALRD